MLFDNFHNHQPQTRAAGLVVTYGSNTRFIRCSGKPLPLSVTENALRFRRSLAITILVWRRRQAHPVFCSRLYHPQLMASPITGGNRGASSSLMLDPSDS